MWSKILEGVQDHASLDLILEQNEISITCHLCSSPFFFLIYIFPSSIFFISNFIHYPHCGYIYIHKHVVIYTDKEETTNAISNTSDSDQAEEVSLIRYSQQSDFRRDLIKGSVRAQRRKTVTWEMF